MSKLQLITRADDAGSCRSANEAILEGVEAGIIKNVSFLAVGPEIEHAVELLGGRDDIAYGFHICFNAEWEDVKWGPLRQSGVFVDSKGNFLPFPNDTKSQGEQIQAGEATWSDGGVRFQFDIVDYQAELVDEIRAQFERLRKLGLRIFYVDEHMGISQIGFGIRECIVKLCSDENLVDHFGVPSLPHVGVQGDELTQFEARLRAASLDKYVWITHPGKDRSDMQKFNLAGHPKGVVAKERDAERRLLTDPRLPELFKKWKVKAVRYDEIKKP